MNEQLQARVQQYISEGRNANWIANELYFEDESLDYNEIKNYVTDLIEGSKKKDLESQEEVTTPLIASVPSEEELDSSAQVPLDAPSIGREYLERFKSDQASLHESIIAEDEEFAAMLQDIRQSDKSDEQKNFEARQALTKRAYDKQKDLLKQYSDEINNRISANPDIDPEKYANILYRDYGLAIPLDGDDRYNESTFFGGSIVDFVTDNLIEIGASAIDLSSDLISRAASAMPMGMSAEQREQYRLDVDQKLADFTELARSGTTQYSTGFAEKATSVDSFSDAAEVLTRSVRGVSQSVPVIGLVAVNPLLAGTVATGNTYTDSKREDYNRVKNGLEPVFDDTVSGNAARFATSVVDGALTATGGKIQAALASQTIKRIATNPATKKTFLKFLKDYGINEGFMAVTEGGVEGFQEFSRMGLEDILGNIDYTSDDYVERITEAFAMGLASSGVISAPGAVKGALDAGSDVVRRPQAAANSRVESSGMTSQDMKNVDSLNKSKAADNILNKDFNQQLRSEKANKEIFYRMMTMRHPQDMKKINDLDIAIEQASIRYKNAKRDGAPEQDLEGITRDVYALVDQRMKIVDSHSGESTDLSLDEKRRYDDGRIAHRIDVIKDDVALLQEQLDMLETESMIPFRVRPEQINDISEKLDRAKQRKTEALRLMGELGSKRQALLANRNAQTEADAYIAEQNLKNHLNIESIDPKVEVKATPEQTQKYSSAKQVENHFEDQENKGSTFTLDGVNQAGQDKTSVSIFPERSKIVEGDIAAEDLDAFVRDNNDLFEGNEDVISVGTWYDSESNQTYIDVAATVDREIGIELGKQYNQKAVWDLKNMEEIDTGGTGTAEADLKPEAERISDIRNLVKGPEPVFADPEPTPQPEEGETFVRGIDGEFEEFAAKQDGSLGITALSGLDKADIRFINKNVASTLKSVYGSNYKIVAHRTKASGDRSSKKEAANIALAVENTDGSFEIHLNLERLAEERANGKQPRAVLMEEILHPTIGPALRQQFASNPKSVYKLINELESIAKSSGREDLVSIVEQKGESYRAARDAKDQEVTEEQVIEYFSELLNYDYSDPTIIDKIRVVINKFIKAAFGKDAMLIEDVSQAKEVLRKLQMSVRTGEAFVVADSSVDAATERAAMSPSKLPESGTFEVQYHKAFFTKKNALEMPAKLQSKTFNGKWDFINWWKYQTNMGQGRSNVKLSNFKLIKEDGSLEDINADVMKNWKLRPPVYKEDRQKIAAERRAEKRELLPKFFKAIQEVRMKEKGADPYIGNSWAKAFEYYQDVVSPEMRDRIDEAKSSAKFDNYFTEEKFGYYFMQDYASLEDVQEAFSKYQEDNSIDNSDDVVERAAIAFTDRIVNDPEVSSRMQAQIRDKARALCGVGAGSCAANDKSSLLQMESSLVKQQIGNNPSLEQSVDIAAQSLEVLRQHVQNDFGIDVADAVNNYASGRQIVMNIVGADPSVDVNPMEFKMMYDLLASYTSNGSSIDPNLNLTLQLFKSGLKRVQSGASEFISPARIEAISKREEDGTLGLVRGDRANTMAKHLLDINQIYKNYLVEGKLDEGKFFSDASKRDASGTPALASMIGSNTIKLAELYLGNNGDPNAIPKDGHFRDQFNIFRGRFNQTDFSEGLAIPEDVRTSSIARLNSLGADVNAMSSDSELFAAIKTLKQGGDEGVRNAAARIYKELVGNNIEQLRSFDAATDAESTMFVKKVAKRMGLTPFQVQQLMYHDGIFSMSSYQGKPFISDYESAMSRSTATDASSVSLDAVPGDQLGLDFPDVDPMTESIMPTPGRKAVTALSGNKNAKSNQLYRERDADVATAVKVRGSDVKISDLVVNEALSTDATSKRIIGKNIEIEPGRKVGVRLNLNVMKNTGVPVQTMHDKTASGEALKYAAAVTVKNAELYVNQNAREKIVTFQENKFPMASVNGEFVASGTDLNYDGVKAVFNPFRHNVFVDMAGRPIKSAEEATIIGGNVFLRGDIEYYDMSDPVVKRGSVESEEARIKRTTRGAKYDKALKRFEGYAKGVLGMEFDSREALESAYDNMVIPSEVAVSESEVANNMGEAMERAALANVTSKFRKAAAKQAKSFEGDIRTKIIKDPRNYITPQKLKSLKKDIQDMSDQELIDIVNDEQLGKISTMNDNMGVLAQAERLARAVARGEADQIPDLVAEMASMGTTAGRLLRHFREVKKSSPKGLASIIKAAAEAKGNKLTEEQDKKLEDITSRMFQAQAIVEDLKGRAIRGEKVGKDLEDAINRLKAIEREMDTFTNVIIERGWGELLGQIAQGNLLTTMSQATNVGANAVNSVFEVGVDVASAPVKAFLSAMNSLVGKKYDNDRRLSLGAYFYAMSHMGRNFVDTIDQVITGQDKDTTEWRQSRGLMPFRSMMAAIGGKDIPASQRAKLAVQGSLGVPAEVMFRLLSLGDTPFRKYFEDKNLYEQAMEMGLEGEALTDFLKHPPRKNAETARTAGRRVTFQEETAFSKGVNETIGFFERTLGSALDSVSSRVDGQQVSKALFRFMIPFRSTPANILIETATFASPVIAAARASAEMKKGNIDEASRHVAKGMIGAVVTEAAVMMLSEGILSGPIQWDEDEEKNLAYDQFPPTSINISALQRMINGEDTAKRDDDVFINYMKLGLPGALMAAVASAYDTEEIKEREYAGPMDFAKYTFSDMVGIGPLSAAGSMMDQSFLQGLNEFVQILAGGNAERSAENLMNSIANVGLSVALPNQFSAIYRAQREFLPDRRVTKDMDFGERLMANLEYTVKDRTFGGAEIPVRVDWKGNPIKQNPRGNVGWMYQLFDITKLRQGEEDPVSQEIYRLFESTETVSRVVSTPSFAKKRKVGVPNITSKKEIAALRQLGKEYNFLNDQKFVDSGVYFNTEQLNNLMAIAGKERYQDVSALINSIDYEFMTDDEKLEALEEINDKYNSVKEFDGKKFRNHTVAILDIMQEIYESGEQQED